MRYPSFVNFILLSVIIILSYNLLPLTPFLTLDDIGILDLLQRTDHNLWQIFFGGGGDYFRPLIFVSFILDLKLFGHDPAAFHLVNLSIHFANTLLLYYLAKLLLQKQHADSENHTSFLAALLFALHPVNVEAVMWVAGRTDLLCCLFFLMAMVVVVEQKLSVMRAVVSLFLMLLLSLLSKEASVGLTGILLVLWFLGRKESDSLRMLFLTISSFTATLFYLFMRTGFHKKLDTGISKVIASGVVKPLWQMMYESVSAFGFYVSKAFFPFPLNFAIVTINKPLSFAIALFAIMGAAYLFYRSSRIRMPLLVFTILLIPPVMAMHGNLPWTPFAERYLYLPMTGFCLMIAVGAVQLPRKVSFSLLVGTMLLGIPTMQRVAVWADSKVFWMDVMEKSPEFPRSYAGVAIELMAEKKYDEAEVLLNKALSMGLDKDYVWGALAKIRLSRNDMDGYEKAMLHLVEITPDSTKVYSNLINTLLNKSTDNATQHKVINYYLMAQQKDNLFGDATYNVAKIYLQLGDKQNALKYFRLFIKTPGNSMYVPFAEKFVKKIEQSTI